MYCGIRGDAPPKQWARSSGFRLGAQESRGDHEEQEPSEVCEAELGTSSEVTRAGPRPQASQAGGTLRVGSISHSSQCCIASCHTNLHLQGRSTKRHPQCRSTKRPPHAWAGDIIARSDPSATSSSGNCPACGACGSGCDIGCSWQCSLALMSCWDLCPDKLGRGMHSRPAQ